MRCLPWCPSGRCSILYRPDLVLVSPLKPQVSRREQAEASSPILVVRRTVPLLDWVMELSDIEELRLAAAEDHLVHRLDHSILTVELVVSSAGLPPERPLEEGLDRTGLVDLGDLVDPRRILTEEAAVEVARHHLIPLDQVVVGAASCQS